jgi:uncharacterized protein YjbI with pentapeptide repeats
MATQCPIPSNQSEPTIANADHVRAAQRANRNKSGVDLRGASLRSANLGGYSLRGANLSRADLSWANLCGADLRGASLSGANLRWANLRGANLCGANFSKADLSEANLSEALLCETDFGAANLRDTKGLAECNFEGPCILDIRAIQHSGLLPLPFLRGCGLPDSFIEYLPSLLNEAIQRFSCVISYSQKDRPFAKRLFDTLQGRDIRCWLNEKRTRPSVDIYEDVDRGIRIWDKMLLCCSKDSLSSWWVDKEISTAFEKEQKLRKERGRKTLALIPLDLDGYLRSGHWQGGKAQQVRSRMVADFRGWNGSHERFESEVGRVVLALQADSGAELSPRRKSPRA